MPRITPLDPTTATGDAVAPLAVARKMFGKIPNLSSTAALAPWALEAMNAFFAATGKSTLGTQRGEQIAIAVAQSNGCGYCLSAHTAIGGMYGLDAATLAAARGAQAPDAKTTALLHLAVAINETRGHISDATLAAARAAGISDAEVVETVALVALNVFTNYLNSVAGTEIDFPVVALDEAA